MREFDVPDLLYNLSRCEMYGHYPVIEDFWNQETKDEFGVMLSNVQKRCEQLDLPVARTLGEQWRRMNLDTYPYPKNVLSKEMSSIRNTIVNEMKDQIYLVIPKEDRKLHQQQEQFGPKVFKAFKAATDDLNAASRCLSVNEYDACVFHLMRAMEVAVQKFGKKVAKFSKKPGGLAFDFYRDTWGDILGKLSPIIKHDMPNGPRKDHYDAIYTSLDHIKRAWRNNNSHPRPEKKPYKPEKARRIYVAVQGFMESLAGEI